MATVIVVTGYGFGGQEDKRFEDAFWDTGDNNTLLIYRSRGLGSKPKLVAEFRYWDSVYFEDQ